LFLGSVLPPYVTHGVCLSAPIKTEDNWKKLVTLAGGCAPEASTLPPVTVSRFFLLFRSKMSQYLPYLDINFT
jgi:hypothetical protein